MKAEIPSETCILGCGFQFDALKAGATVQPLAQVVHPIIRHLNHSSVFIDHTLRVKEKSELGKKSLALPDKKEALARRVIQESPWGAPLR